MKTWKVCSVLLAVLLASFGGAALAWQSDLLLWSWRWEGKSLVEVRSAQTLAGAGSEMGRGAIRLNDTIADRQLELGYYEYGAGLFTSSLFEFFSNGVSVRSFDGVSMPYLDVRDAADRSDIRLSHDGTQGHLYTTGWEPGGIKIGGNGPTTLASQVGDVLRVEDDGSISLYGGGSLFVGEGGALLYRSPRGAVSMVGRP